MSQSGWNSTHIHCLFYNYHSQAEFYYHMCVIRGTSKNMSSIVGSMFIKWIWFTIGMIISWLESISVTPEIIISCFRSKNVYPLTHWSRSRILSPFFQHFVCTFCILDEVKHLTVMLCGFSSHEQDVFIKIISVCLYYLKINLSTNTKTP